MANSSLLKRRAICYDLPPQHEVPVQLDMFDETLEKKIIRMEKWMYRLSKELDFLKEVYLMRQDKKSNAPEKPRASQLDLFGT